MSEPETTTGTARSGVPLKRLVRRIRSILTRPEGLRWSEYRKGWVTVSSGLGLTVWENVWTVNERGQWVIAVSYGRDVDPTNNQITDRPGSRTQPLKDGNEN